MKIPIAGLLAERGHYDGWPLIVEQVERGIYLWDTARALPHFRNMPTADGAPIDVLSMLKRLQERASEDYKPVIGAEIKAFLAAESQKSESIDQKH